MYSPQFNSSAGLNGVHGLNVKRATRSIDLNECCGHPYWSTLNIWLNPTLKQLPPTPAPITGRSSVTPSSFGTVPDYVCRHAESLIEILSEEHSPSADAAASSSEVIVDGYAHVLALDVDRLRLEREIARLAESGDPQVAGQLRELSILLRRVTATSKRLRTLLGEVRSRNEL
jgi:hypothetical protein